MKACVFVDGENFRHSIVELFPQFRQEEYLPKLASWSDLFDWIVRKVTENGERIRTYWYVIESVDFFPYFFPDPSEAESPSKATDARVDLQKLLSKHDAYKDELNSLDDKQRAGRMSAIVKELSERKSTFRKRFDGWHTLQNGIAIRHKAIEFRRAGTIKFNLFDNSLEKEKAVDVKLASDMIRLKDIYDVAIIMSGDQDYVPVVEVVKDFGKRVVNVAFETRSGKLLPGGARRLNQVADWCLNISYQDLNEHLRLS